MVDSAVASQREVPGKQAPHSALPIPSSLQAPAAQVALGISEVPLASQVTMASPSQRAAPGVQVLQPSAPGTQEASTIAPRSKLQAGRETKSAQRSQRASQARMN